VSGTFIDSFALALRHYATFFLLVYYDVFYILFKIDSDFHFMAKINENACRSCSQFELLANSRKRAARK